MLRAGLGRIGRNQMMINNRYGSYFFAAYMTLSTPLEPDPPVVYANGISCLDCGACVKACPGQAMLPDGAFRPERCRSGITQKSGALEPWEKEILLKGDTIFGCDVCQLVCPLNRDAEQTPLQTFRENRIESLYPEDLEGLSRREFMKKYEDRAFNWKGPAVLRRNLSLMSERQEESNGDREKIPVRSAAAGETPLQASGSGLHQP